MHQWQEHSQPVLAVGWSALLLRRVFWALLNLLIRRNLSAHPAPAHVPVYLLEYRSSLGINGGAERCCAAKIRSAGD